MQIFPSWLTGACLLLALAPTIGQTTDVEIHTPVASLSIATAEALNAPDVRMLFRAEDINGNPVWGLDASDFLVLEEGDPAEIVSFRPLNTPEVIRIALLLDISGSMEGEPLNQAKAAIVHFLQHSEKDVAFVPFHHVAYDLSDTLTSTSQILSLLPQIQAGGGTAVYDAVMVGNQALTSLNSGAHQPAADVEAIVALTDGQDGDSYWGMQDVVNALRQSQTPVYTIGLGGADSLVLRDLASMTGGQAHFTSDPAELQRIYEDIESDLSSFYELTYRSETLEALPGRDSAQTAQVLLRMPQLDLNAHYPPMSEAEVAEALAAVSSTASFPWGMGILGTTLLAAGLLVTWAIVKRRKPQLAITNLYPNPALGATPLTVDFTGSASLLTVFSLQGTELHSEPIPAAQGAQSFTFILPQLPAGGAVLLRLTNPASGETAAQQLLIGQTR